MTRLARAEVCISQLSLLCFVILLELSRRDFAKYTQNSEEVPRYLVLLCLSAANCSPNKAFIKDRAILRSPVDRLSSYIPIQVGFPRVVWHRRVIEDIYMGLGPPELLPVRIAAYPAGL